MSSILTRRSPGLWLSLFLIAGCGSTSPTTPTTDFISITSIVPAAGTTLTAGDRVTFTAVVSCTIVSSNGGRTAMVIQDQRNVTLLDAGQIEPTATLQRGTATVTLSQTITIPTNGSTTVRVFLPIFVDESTSTRAMVTRDYPVR